VKAVRFHRVGEPDVLRYEDVPEPKPGAGEVLIKVKACSVNRLDIWLRSGLYPSHLPHILGSEFAGEIAGLGEGVKGYNLGSRVVIYPGITDGVCEHCLLGDDSMCENFGIVGSKTDGGYAEYAVVPAENVFEMPESVSYEEAASTALVFLTAWHMLVKRAGLKVGERVLIHAAGSGIGSAAVQIAKISGAEVFVTAGTDEKLSKAEELGAEHLINYNKTDFAQEMQSLTGGRGVDVVFEHTGAATFAGSMSSLAKGGRLVIAGATTGADARIDIRQLYGRQISVVGSMLGNRSELVTILELVRQKKLNPVIDRVLPLSDARKAHELMDERGQFGKIVLKP